MFDQRNGSYFSAADGESNRSFLELSLSNEALISVVLGPSYPADVVVLVIVQPSLLVLIANEPGTVIVNEDRCRA